MTEPIIITLIIVGGLVALAWIALHFGYKAWSAERADAKLGAEKLATLAPVKQSPTVEYHFAPTSAEQVAEMARDRTRQYPFYSN